jgi:hypothetical protein
LASFGESPLARGINTFRISAHHNGPMGSFGMPVGGRNRPLTRPILPRLPMGSWLMSPNCWSASTVPSPGRVPERGCELALKGMPARPSPPAGTGPEQRPTSWGHEPRSQWHSRGDGSRSRARSLARPFPRTNRHDLGRVARPHENGRGPDCTIAVVRPPVFRASQWGAVLRNERS